MYADWLYISKRAFLLLTMWTDFISEFKHWNIGQKRRRERKEEEKERQEKRKIERLW